MRLAATLLLLLFGGPFCGAGWAQTERGAGFDMPAAVSVITAALGFIAPRALDAVSVEQLALWGLSAPGSLDGALSTELRDGAVVLLRNGVVVYSRHLPGSADLDNADVWGTLAAEVLQAAWTASADFRAGGTQGAITSFFDEMFNHMDPYSRYVAPAAADQDRARRSGEAGAGITVARRGAAFVVTGLNADGPGAEAGIRVGDRVVAVDDQPTAGETLETVQGWISGPDGTDVSITVRTRAAAPRTVTLEREVVPPETVFPSYAGNLLVLRISAFSRDTDQRVASELERDLGGKAGGRVRGIVLDLRGNRGGLLRQAVATIDLMLDHGLIATTAGRDPQADHSWRASDGDLTSGRPIVVLVDGRSASAAEIMAAALADEGRAVVVGSATLGKGLVQTIGTMPDGGELFVSWSRVLAPDGWPLQGLGVLPQVCTSAGEEQLTAQLQALDRGVQPMAAALARHHAARAPLPAAEALALRGVCPASEARDTDMVAARFLVAHPAAYAAARLSPPP